MIGWLCCDERWESSSFYLPPCGAWALHVVMVEFPYGAIFLWGDISMGRYLYGASSTWMARPVD